MWFNLRKILVPLWATIRYKPYKTSDLDLKGLFHPKWFYESLILVLYGFFVDIIDEKDYFSFFFPLMCHTMVSSSKVECWNPCSDGLALYVKASDEVYWTHTFSYMRSLCRLSHASGWLWCELQCFYDLSLGTSWCPQTQQWLNTSINKVEICYVPNKVTFKCAHKLTENWNLWFIANM